MSRARASLAKLIIGVFLKDKALIGDLEKLLLSSFGEIEIASLWIDFDFTKYYEKEMGKPLFRRLFVFKDLVEQDALSQIKQDCMKIEDEYSIDEKRQINIDPGILLLEKFILATRKNFSHRIYIGDDVYADLTLIYKKGEFSFLDWTYPDYKSQEILKFLHLVRKRYFVQLREI